MPVDFGVSIRIPFFCVHKYCVWSGYAVYLWRARFSKAALPLSGIVIGGCKAVHFADHGVQSHSGPDKGSQTEVLCSPSSYATVAPHPSLALGIFCNS